MAGYVGGTTAYDLQRLRRMVAEPTTTTYTDGVLTEAIQRYPVPDGDDVYPDESGWIPSFDLASASAEIWAEKASAVASNFDFDADGATFSKSQQYDHFIGEARRWHSRRVPGVWIATPLVPERTADWIGNLNDPYE